MKAELSELVLTCGSWQEAQAIADSLLEKNLVACVEFMEVKSSYLWNKSVSKADEIKLIMLTKPNNFNEIEKQVKKLHSYDTFVLQSLPVSKVSTKADGWLSKELNG
jgi:periplasmic divalent cation tolerance protein